MTSYEVRSNENFRRSATHEPNGDCAPAAVHLGLRPAPKPLALPPSTPPLDFTTRVFPIVNSQS